MQNLRVLSSSFKWDSMVSYVDDEVLRVDYYTFQTVCVLFGDCEGRV